MNNILDILSDQKSYEEQQIANSEFAKTILVIGKEIILDKDISNEKLGEIVRQMYKAKVEYNDAIIERSKELMKNKIA